MKPDTSNFQPIPKRFMVWGQRKQKFIDGEPLTIDDIVCSNSIRERIGELDFIQSTNLFDKDNKEIFEGHLVRWNEDVGIVEQHNGKWTFHIVTPAFAVYHELGPNSDMVKVIGHILSNPELLEEE